MAKQTQRRDLADYINIATSGTADFKLMGTGFTALDESPNAKSEKKTYVCDKSSTSRVNGYEPSWKADIDRIEDEAAIAFILKIGEEQLTGADAEADIVRVNKNQKVASSSGEYYARKIHVSIEVSDLAGKAGEGATISAKFNQIGDITIGKFKLADKTFTANA